MTEKQGLGKITDAEKKRQPKIFLLLSFLLPAFLLGCGFVYQNVHPFGDRQILVTDFWHQYYPFLRVLHEKLRSGGSFLYTWESGMGTNFLSMLAYYAASPLNLLTVFVPDSFLREAVTLILLCKVGFAGFFFALFLRGTFRRNDFSLCLFGSMYALCSYILGYYWNIIWLDTVALLPLVVLGLVYLVRDGKYRLYVIALALSLLTNFYIGMFTCIFSVIAFLCLCVFYVPLRQLMGRVGMMVLCSLLGGALSGVLLLPMFLALQLTHSVSNVFPTAVEFYENWRTLFANLISYQEPTSKEGLPNLGCGVPSLVLLGVFLRSRSVRIREKIAAILVLGFLLFSCNCNVLNFLWHGCHVPNMLPYRFSFLFSFVLLTVGYRGFLVVLQEKMKALDIVAMLLMTIVIFLLSYGVQENKAVWWTLATMVLFTVVLMLFYQKLLGKRLLYLALSVVLGFELVENVWIGTDTVSTSSYEGYPLRGEAVETLLNEIEETDSELFYRTEMSSVYTLNDPALYGYNGLSQFSSTANESVTKWMRALGLPASEAGNRYYYFGSSPVIDLFCDIRYVLSRGDVCLDTKHWGYVTNEEGVSLYQNQYPISVGFVADAALSEYACNPEGNPFENQNTLFSLATGIETPLFTKLEVDHVQYLGADATKSGYGAYHYQVDTEAEKSTLSFYYDVPVETTLYAYVSASEGQYISVTSDGLNQSTFSPTKQPGVFPMGTFLGTETPGLTVTLGQDTAVGALKVYVYAMNESVWEEGYEKLSAGSVELTAFSDTTVEGTVTAATDGLCYFSIPYEAGWHAFVDGEKTEVTPVGDAMVAIPISAGSHTVTLRYRPAGFTAGSVISMGALLMLLVLAGIEKKRGKPILSPVSVGQPAATQETEELVSRSEESEEKP